MKIGTLVKGIDGFIGIVIAIGVLNDGAGYVQIQTKPDKDGYVRRSYPTRHLEVICK